MALNRIGLNLQLFLSLIAAATLLYHGDALYGPPSCVFLLTLQMLITLVSLSNILHEAKGTAFGLSSFSLVIGAYLRFWDFA